MYFRGSCYQIYTVPKNQDEAEAVCQQNGYHLATINTVEEHHFIQGHTQRLDRKQKLNNTMFIFCRQCLFITLKTGQWIRHKGYRTGLRYDSSSSAWAWQNGEEAGYIAWQSGHPNPSAADYCAYINAWDYGYFVSSACWEKIWFICEMELV